MKDKILILFLSLIFKILFITNTLGEEIKFEANVIEFLDKDKKIIAEKNVKIFSNTGVVINADKMVYNKEIGIINAEGEIIIENNDNDVFVKSIDKYSIFFSFDNDFFKYISLILLSIKPYFLKIGCK